MKRKKEPIHHLSALRMLKAAWPTDWENSKQVRLVGHRILKTEDKLKLRTLTYDIKKKEKRPHRQMIYCEDPDFGGVFSEASNLKVSCDCERWMFTYEYAMATKWNAADIIHCNGDPPVETNPSLLPGVCKHLIVVLSWILLKKI